MNNRDFDNLITACQVDLDEINYNCRRNYHYGFDDEQANINFMKVNRLRKSINERLLKIEKGVNVYE